MAYIIINKDEVNIGKHAKVYLDKDFYVYDTTDSTIEQCTGRDIQLLVKHDREFLNYKWGNVNDLVGVCMVHPDIGLYLNNGIMLVAWGEHLWEISRITSLEHIVFMKDMLALHCYTDMIIEVVLYFQDSTCSLLDLRHRSSIVYKQLGMYKKGQAGAEIVRRCI